MTGMTTWIPLGASALDVVQVLASVGAGAGIGHHGAQHRRGQ